MSVVALGSSTATSGMTSVITSALLASGGKSSDRAAMAVEGQR